MTAELTQGLTNSTGTTTLDPFIWQFFATVENSSTLLTNGSFSTCSESCSAASLADLNSNGYLDVFIVIRNSGNQVWTNNGTGTLFDSGQSLGLI